MAILPIKPYLSAGDDHRCPAEWVLAHSQAALRRWGQARTAAFNAGHFAAGMGAGEDTQNEVRNFVTYCDVAEKYWRFRYAAAAAPGNWAC